MLLTRDAILEALKRDSDQEQTEAFKRDARRLIDALRRDSRRFQEEFVEAPSREFRRVQEQMETLKRQPALEALEALKRDSRRFQEEMEAARRALSGPDPRSEMLELIRSWRADPYWVLLDPSSTLKQRRTAARRIAAAQPSMRFKRPAVRAALRGLPTSERDEWLREVFAHALVAAGKESETPLRRIRLGRWWVKDRLGRVREHIAPLALSLPQARRWLLQRARHLTELTILEDDSGRSRRRLSRRDRAALGEDRQGVEGMSEYHPTPPETLRTVRLSKRQRQLYEFLLAGTSITDVATRLGLSPGAVRVLRSRLLKRLKTVTTSPQNFAL